MCLFSIIVVVISKKNDIDVIIVLITPNITCTINMIQRTVYPFMFLIDMQMYIYQDGATNNFRNLFIARFMRNRVSSHDDFTVLPHISSVFYACLVQ